MKTTETINNELAIFNKAVQNKKNISDSDIQRLLDIYRKVLCVDAVYMFHVLPTNNALIFTNVSASNDGITNTTRYMKFLNEKFKSSRKKFDQENLYSYTNTSSKNQVVKSLLQYGVFTDEFLEGCIGIIDSHKEREWTKSERNAVLKLGRTLHYIIIESRQAKLVEDQELKMKALENQTQILQAMAEIYLTVHLIDLKTDKSFEFNSFSYARQFTDKSTKASEQIKLGIFNSTLPEDREMLGKFIDFSTLEKRLGNKKSIYLDFCGIHFGWTRAQFIATEFDEKQHLSKVVFTTQIINEEKNRELNLIKISNTDELTQVKNRRCYEVDIKEISKNPIPDDLVLVSFDLNSLKITNDEKGHAAGDELLKGVAECITAAFGADKKIYRTGGDEFACIFYSGTKELKKMLNAFRDVQKKWKGKINDKISISFGFARAAENKGKTIHELEKIADHMMYADKKAYYENKKNERRSHER